MKVKIGPYVKWFGPYQLAEFLCFWVPKKRNENGTLVQPRWVHKFGEFIAHGRVSPDPKVGEVVFFNAKQEKKTWIYNLLEWIHEKKTRKISVRIDHWDTWSMDHTLSYIVLPMLKRLKDEAHGAPFVDDEDVPEALKRSNSREASQEEKSNGAPDDNYFKRWDWVLDEMIFAFESKQNDSWEDQFYSGDGNFGFEKQENGNFMMVADGNDDFKCDAEGRKKYQERISNGFRLFGKYYESLWT